jgi:hypothetical protein
MLLDSMFLHFKYGDRLTTGNKILHLLFEPAIQALLYYYLQKT